MVGVWAALGLHAVAWATRVAIDFEELPLTTADFYNGADGAGGFTTQGAFFHNRFVAFGTLGYWEGWAYSRARDVVTGNWTNQYSSASGAGADGSTQYAVAYSALDGNPTAPAATSPRIDLPPGAEPVSVAVNNTTYAALVMRDGDPNHLSAQFGGDDGAAPDWFLLRIDGLGADGQRLASVERYLADYRNVNGAPDSIQTAWERMDLSPLAGRGVRTLDFRLASSDANVGGNGTVPGILTPAYVAVDDLVLRLDAQLSADFDANGGVDARDAEIWQIHWGSLASGAARRDQGDANADGWVEGSDWLVWQRELGATASVATTQNAVPELSAASVAMVVVYSFLLTKRHPCYSF